jgi:hypothetical protein
MYPFKRGPKKNAPTFHFPVDDNEFQFELPDSSIFFVRGPDRAVIIRRCNSMPDTGEESIQGGNQTHLSGGFLFRQRIHREKIETQ